MVNIDCLCKGCMRLLDSPGGCCPVCGYDNTQTEMRNARCLPEQTILNGRYLIGRVLGEGGFGITYLAFDLAEEHPVAIKEYFPVGLAARDMSTSLDERILVMPGEQGVHYRNGLKGFAKEGQNLAHFEKLPGIVTARDFFFANETAYLVMDYVEGQSLKQYMQWYQKNNKNGAPMDYPVALEFLKPVMSSLAEIHKAGLIHRDISPDNILVDKNGNVTLIDFGAARADVGNEFRSMTVMVKHGYAPEEQYRSHGKQGPWTDVYALCATLYHMISGILPMDAVERLYRDEMIPLKNLKLPVPVPEEISDIIEKGMAVRAENRYHSMEELCSDINRAEERQLEKEEREKLEAERKAKEEARLEAERQAEEARREAIRKEREEAERKAEKLRKEKQEQERKEREEEKRKREEALREEEEKRQQEEEKRQREEKRIEDKKREPAEGEKKCFRRYGFYGKTAVCLGLINMIWLIRSSSYDCQPFAWATGLLPIELAAFHAAAGAAALLILIFGKKGKGYGGLVFPLLIGIQGVLIGNKVFLNVFFVKFHSLYRLYWTRFCMAVILCGSFSILAALRKKRKQQKMAVCCEAAAILLVIVGIVLNFRFFGVYLKYGKGLEGYQFYYTFFLPAAVILEFAGAWSACISCLKEGREKGRRSGALWVLVKLAPPLIAAFAVFTVRACAANELPGQIAGIVEYTLEKTWSEERNRLGERKTSYHSDSDIAFEWKYQVSEWEDAWTRASADGVEYKKYPANIYVGDMTGDTCYYLLLDAYGYEFGEEDTEYGENWTADVSMSSTFLFWTGSGLKDKIAAELIQMLERRHLVSEKNLLRNDELSFNTTELTLYDKTEVRLSFPDPMRISLQIEHIPAVETDISNPELSVGELIGYLVSSWGTEQHFDTEACQCLELQGYVFLTGDGYSAVIDDGRVPFSSGTIGKEAEIGLEALSYEELEEVLMEYFGPVWDESESCKRFSTDGECFLELSRITENESGTVYRIRYTD